MDEQVIFFYTTVIIINIWLAAKDSEMKNFMITMWISIFCIQILYKLFWG